MPVTWIRSAGRIMPCGDSITVGHNALTGGWRKKLFADLATARIKFVSVGPYTTSSPGMTETAHRGVSGDRASSAVTILASQFSTYNPALIILGFGMNDLGNGEGSTAYLSNIGSIMTLAKAATFARVVIVQTLILPTSAYPPYYADIADYQTSQAALPALVQQKSCVLSDIGTPALSDGVHPSDGASGYDAMATGLYNTILSSIP